MNGAHGMVWVLLIASLLHVANGSSAYSTLCDSVFCSVLGEANAEINKLRETIHGGSCIPKFGVEADRICNTALETFTSRAPPDDSSSSESIYDKKVEELERSLDAPLHVLYLKQISLLREKAIKNFKQALSTEGSEYEAMMVADEFFRREAEESTRQNPDWDYVKESQMLKQTLGEVAGRAKKITEVKLSALKQNQQAMQFLQMQQQQLQAIQQQVQGASSPWNIGAAYRLPDSNINLSLGYQQGRANVVLSCVPDEAVPLLGPNGFVNGVTPGNIGLSFNINI